jgi:hypothetical protein
LQAGLHKLGAQNSQNSSGTSAEPLIFHADRWDLVRSQSILGQFVASGGRRVHMPSSRSTGWYPPVSNARSGGSAPQRAPRPNVDPAVAAIGSSRLDRRQQSPTRPVVATPTDPATATPTTSLRGGGLGRLVGRSVARAVVGPILEALATLGQSFHTQKQASIGDFFFYFSHF